MIIGIDATPFSHPQPGGYKTYVTNLLTAMSQLPTQRIFRVFLDREVAPEVQARLPGGHGIIVSNKVPVLRQFFREQWQLPAQAAKEHCAIAHFTANTAPIFSPTPYILTLHDIIALTEPQASIALSSRQLWQWGIGMYTRSIIPTAVKGSQAVITVSEFEKRQIADHFKLPADRIHAIHLAPNPIFQPLPQPQRKAARDQVLNRHMLGQRYLLAIGHEPRKNIMSVIQAYQQIDARLREECSLLIVCARQHARQTLQQQIDSLCLSEKVQVLPGQAPEELLQLYNGASALVFPSVRESFGLPPLEAMACGTPVIASNTTCLPEVLGDAGMLIAPMDTAEIADAINRVLTNPGLADELRARGLAHVASFSWLKTAQQTLGVYELNLRA
jgi:glycosyltransferase involved in cell wall biosynthesis